MKLFYQLDSNDVLIQLKLGLLYYTNMKIQSTMQHFNSSWTQNCLELNLGYHIWPVEIWTSIKQQQRKRLSIPFFCGDQDFCSLTMAILVYLRYFCLPSLKCEPKATLKTRTSLRTPYLVGLFLIPFPQLHRNSFSNCFSHYRPCTPLNCCEERSV